MIFLANEIGSLHTNFIDLWVWEKLYCLIPYIGTPAANCYALIDDILARLIWCRRVSKFLTRETTVISHLNQSYLHSLQDIVDFPLCQLISSQFHLHALVLLLSIRKRLSILYGFSKEVIIEFAKLELHPNFIQKRNNN